MPVTPGATPTEVNLGDAPSAQAGFRLGVWQAGTAYPDPNFPEKYVRDTSVELPNVGGDDPRTTTTETITTASLGKLVRLNNAGAIAVTLDSTVANYFWCPVLITGAGAATFTPSTGTINGAASASIGGGGSPPLGGILFFNGTNWWLLETGGGSSVTFSGDLSGSDAGPQTVVGLEGKPLDATTVGSPSDGWVITYNAASGKYKAQAAASGFTAGGDLSGTSTSQEVVGILGAAIDSSGSWADGDILQYSSSSGKLERLVDRPMFPVSGVPGRPLAGQIVCIYTSAVALIFPANFASPNSYGSCGTNPTSTALYTIYKNGSQIGTISISTGGLFTFATTGGATQSMAAGDRLIIVAPGTQDATLSDVGITLACTRTATVPSSSFAGGIFTFRGAYNGATSYNANDVVSYQGGLYVCILPSTGNLPTNATYWTLMVGFEWNFRGAYSHSASYVPNDVATSGGSTYLCILATTGNDPPNATYWSVIAAAGTVSAAQVQQEALIYADDTGTANAYAISISPTPTIVEGSCFVFKALHANTAASTLAVNGGTATAITKNGTNALTGAEISAGEEVEVVFDGTQWQIISSAGAAGGNLTAEYIVGDSPVPANLTNAKSWTGLYNHPDIPPTSPTAYDDEFDAGSLNARWTWVNQGSATAAFSKSRIQLSAPSASSSRTLQFIEQTLPSAPYEFTAKVTVYCAGQYGEAGLLLYESGTGKCLGIALSSNGSGAWYIRGGAYSSITSGTLTTRGSYGAFAIGSNRSVSMYLRIGRSGSTVYLAVSEVGDGTYFDQILSESLTTDFTTAPDHVGMYLQPYSLLTTMCSDWFRRTI